MDIESSLLLALNAYQEGLPNSPSPILPPRLHQQSWFFDNSSSFYDHDPRRDSSLTEYVLQIIEDEENAEYIVCFPALDKEPEKNGVQELVRLLDSCADNSTTNQQDESLFPLADLLEELEPTPIGPDAKVLPSSSSMLQCCKQSLSACGPTTTTRKTSSIIPAGGEAGLTLDEVRSNRCKDESVYYHRLMGGGSALFINFEAPPRTRSMPSFQKGNNNKQEGQRRFRAYEEDLWTVRFNELLQFKDAHGHCLVPHTYPENLLLSQWVKRQRYQFKLKAQGRHSTLTDDRQKMLDAVGFVWHCHHAAWYEKLEELKKYHAQYGDCRVPHNYPPDRSLAVWVKRQRRQWKLFRNGRAQVCAISKQRIALLDRIGFEWNPRGL